MPSFPGRGRRRFFSAVESITDRGSFPGAGDSLLGGDNNLVFIGRGFGVDALSKSLRHFAGLRG